MTRVWGVLVEKAKPEHRHLRNEMDLDWPNVSDSSHRQKGDGVVVVKSSKVLTYKKILLGPAEGLFSL